MDMRGIFDHLKGYLETQEGELEMKGYELQYKNDPTVLIIKLYEGRTLTLNLIIDGVGQIKRMFRLENDDPYDVDTGETISMYKAEDIVRKMIGADTNYGLEVVYAQILDYFGKDDSFAILEEQMEQFDGRRAKESRFNACSKEHTFRIVLYEEGTEKHLTIQRTTRALEYTTTVTFAQRDEVIREGRTGLRVPASKIISVIKYMI